MTQPTFRLAFRVEGDFWYAYVARMESMKDATIIGSIAIGAVQDEQRRRQFMELMKDSLRAAVDELGLSISWPNAPEPAPEHERTGRT